MPQWMNIPKRASRHQCMRASFCSLVSVGWAGGAVVWAGRGGGGGGGGGGWGGGGGGWGGGGGVGGGGEILAQQLGEVLGRRGVVKGRIDVGVLDITMYRDDLGARGGIVIPRGTEMDFA